MTVTIPACEQHEGFFSMTVTISDYCPKCGEKRGIDTIHKGFSYDGSRRLTVDCWTNPCGHVDKYSEVREEVKRQNKLNVYSDTSLVKVLRDCIYKNEKLSSQEQQQLSAWVECAMDFGSNLDECADQLTKAKEIIKDLLQSLYCWEPAVELDEIDNSRIEQAEQFLKE